MSDVKYNANVIFGRQPVVEALKANTPIEKILILYGTKGNAIEKIRTLAKQHGVPVSDADKQKFRGYADESTTQGVIAFLAPAPFAELEDILAAAKQKNEPPFILILDELEDPHNIGALIRTAECAGIHGVIVPKHHSASIGETVAKTSAGASLHVPIARVSNIVQAMEELKKNGLWIVGTAMEGDRTYYETDYKGPIAIVVGNEGRGIRRLVKEKCDFLVRIPLYGKIESLNASVAGALVMFEAVKNRQQKK